MTGLHTNVNRNMQRLDQKENLYILRLPPFFTLPPFSALIKTLRSGFFLTKRPFLLPVYRISLIFKLASFRDKL